MEIQVQNKLLQGSIKTLKKVFDKGVVVDPGHLTDCVLTGNPDGTVTLETASNGLSLSTTMLADVQAGGKVVVHRDYLSVKFPAPGVQFKHEARTDRMGFVSGSLRGDIAVSHAVSDLEARRPLKLPELTIELPLEQLQAGCRRICFAPSTSEPLNLRIVVADGSLVMTANDRYRGAAVKIPLTSPRGAGEIHIPAVILTNALASIDDTIVRLGFDDRSFRLKGGGVDICHPLLQDLQTPVKDVWKIVESLEAADSSTAMWARFAAADAKAAVDAVASIPFAKNEGDARVTLTPSAKGRIDVQMTSSLSQAHYEFDVEEIEINESVPMAFNQRYLSEFFGLMGQETVEAIATDRSFIVRVAESMVWVIPTVAT